MQRNYTIKLDRQFSLNRFDIMIDNNYIPKILEVNSVEIGLMQIRVFPEICKLLVNRYEHYFFIYKINQKTIKRYYSYTN